MTIDLCPCECNRGGFCGGCGHYGCSGGINVPKPRKTWDSHCKECGEYVSPTEERCEVYLDADEMKAYAGGQWVLVDDIPEDQFGPYILHAECYLAHESKYRLA